MSATGRANSVKLPQSAYQTPIWVVETLLGNWNFPEGGTFLEPCCGMGNILKTVRNQLKFKSYIGCEINKELLDFAKSEYIYKPMQNTTYFYNVDFFEQRDWHIDVIITNPPYTVDGVDIARKFLLKCFKFLNTGGQMAFLLRLNYLGSQKRKKLNNLLPLKGLLVLSKRPSFTGKGTDATEYSWNIYQKGYKGLVDVKVI